MFLVDHQLTEEQKMLRELVRQIAEEKISPVSREMDEKEEFPTEIMKVLAQSDLFSLSIPSAYGGMGTGLMELCIATEEISRVDGGVAASYAASFLGMFPILLFGTEEQKKKYLPSIASGEKLAAFALTEPEAGSDASAVKTTAKLDGDHYILNGTKHFITNGGDADVYTVIAATNKKRGARGMSAFIVDKGTEGFSFGKKEEKLGIRASSTGELIFEDARVPVANLLGQKEGIGFIATMKTFDQSRPGVAAQAVGIAQGALEAATKYAHQRVQFGQPITSFQGIQWMLADMATKTEAARSLVYATASMVDRGIKSVGGASAAAKLFASDVAMEVTTEAVQIYGGYGYMKEYPVEKFMRDAKITQIYEGTNQIQKDIIALNLIKKYAK
ncbi:MAG: acyl-CoA dehydrogenase family protein [Candidatus Omnitrophica bacterium]|nr:acyl-CoA dehydrogenase family protein [Candidatus Omnitrophota bacterium]MCF7897702.1 acyl-CoA dehydrogenase family protein [Candidatus Omnitrophota bacterium]MCF7909490.1 acyl-CoA dehydrogenase family protein [Candidatus Omnitrophota bacterium]